MLRYIAVVVALISLVSSHPGGHSHSHGDASGTSGKQPNYLTCASQTKSQELMDISKHYKKKHELENQRADAFVAKMKAKKDRSFRKDVSSFGKSQKDSILDKISDEERRNLFSEYDDEIANTPVLRIPIVFHVLYSTSRGNLPDAQLDSQIDVLNKDFRATNDEILAGEVANIWSDRVGDTKIEFYKHDTKRVAISSDAICLNQTQMKLSQYGGSSAVDPKYYLNAWICNISSEGLLGYAYQPCLIDTIYEWADGLVLGSDNVGSIKDDDGTFWFPDNWVYDEGRTGTHEIGHYLNLDHIWGTETTDSCSDTDNVDDTPPSLASNYGCPDNTTNTCTATDPELGRDLRDMYENFMDYTNDECMFIFTEEQVWRMRSVLSGSGCRREMYYAGAQLSGNQTLMPSTVRTTGGTFSCNDGCPIAEDYVDDQFCDCSECEDEASWTCSSCAGGCPTECDTFTACTSLFDFSPAATITWNIGSTIFLVAIASVASFVSVW